jgi:predicted phage tail protein
MTILLYGFLGKKFGKVHKYYVKTPAEAVQAMCATLKGFKQAVIDGGSYRVLVGGRDTLTKEQLVFPISCSNTLRIVPTVSGAGNGWVTTIIGYILIIVGVVLSVFTEGASLVLVDIGAAMVAAGVAQLIFAPKGVQALEPRDSNPVQNRPSHSFNGTVNTVSQGNPVPVCYGRVLVGSQVISAGLIVEQE